jgi:hypothetical protein
MENTVQSNQPFCYLRFVKYSFIQLAFQRLAGHVLFTFKASIKVEAQTNLHVFQNIRQTTRAIEPKMFWTLSILYTNDAKVSFEIVKIKGFMNVNKIYKSCVEHCVYKTISSIRFLYYE